LFLSNSPSIKNIKSPHNIPLSAHKIQKMTLNVNLGSSNFNSTLKYPLNPTTYMITPLTKKLQKYNLLSGKNKPSENFIKKNIDNKINTKNSVVSLINKSTIHKSNSIVEDVYNKAIINKVKRTNAKNDLSFNDKKKKIYAKHTKSTSLIDFISNITKINIII